MPSSWKSTIGCAPNWFAIIAGPVPSFVTLNLSVVLVLVWTIVVPPFVVKVPSILTSPTICTFLSGNEVPIPTLPPPFVIITSVLLLSFKYNLSVESTLFGFNCRFSV